MNNTLKTKYLQRVDQLIKLAYKLGQTEEDIGNDRDWLLSFSEWRIGTEKLLLMAVSEDSPHHREFQLNMANAYKGSMSKVIVGTGILESLKSELELGLLGEVENLVRAEVFTDFLEMAQHLLQTGYKDPAAVLVSTVLENGLRRIAEKQDVAVKDKDDISSLNTKLGDANAYSKLDRSQIQTWKKLRDSATHGKYDEYTKPKVEAMLEGVRRFLAEHLG